MGTGRTSPRKHPAVRLAAYGEAVAGQVIVDAAVGHEGHPVLLTTDRADLPASPTRFRDPWLALRQAVPVPRGFRLVELLPAGPRVVALRAPTPWLAQVQPLPGGRWLLVPTTAAQDATLLVAGPDGALLAPIALEDQARYLSGVTTTPGGHLWTQADDRSAWKGRGLQCHDPAGRHLHDAAALPGGTTVGARGYTYALTPSGPDEVHAYVYGDDWALMALDPRRLTRVWDRLPVAFATTFAVSPTHALFGPGPDDQPRLTLVDLRGEERGWGVLPTAAGPVARYAGTLRAERIAPVDERGRPLGFVRTAAHGDRFLLFTHDAAFAISVAELARPATDLAPGLGDAGPSGLEPTLGDGG